MSYVNTEHANKCLVSVSSYFHHCYLQDSMLDTTLIRTSKTHDLHLMSFELKAVWHRKKCEDVCRLFLLIPPTQHCVWHIANLQYIFEELVDPLNKRFSTVKIWLLCHLFPPLSRKNKQIQISGSMFNFNFVILTRTSLFFVLHTRSKNHILHRGFHDKWQWCIY